MVFLFSAYELLPLLLWLDWFYTCLPWLILPLRQGMTDCFVVTHAVDIYTDRHINIFLFPQRGWPE